MNLYSIDSWIGRTFFVPIIIRICQFTRQSQFAIARLLWFIAALDGLYHAETMFQMVIWGGLSVVMMITASTRADSPAMSMLWFRLIGIALLALDIVGALALGEWAAVEFWVIVLFAEYAATIRTITPLEDRKKKAQVAKVEG